MAKIIKTLIFLSIFMVVQAYANSAIRIPLHTEKISFDTSRFQDTSSLWVSRQVNCQLLRVRGGVPVMDVTKSIRYISPTSIDFKLKKGVYFSNGKQLTAEDVVATIDYLQRKSGLRNVLHWIKSVNASGENEVIITLKQPTPQFLRTFAAPNYALFEKDFLAAAEKNPSLWKSPITCGEYRITENTPRKIRIEPVHQGLPIDFYLIPDSQLSVNDVNKYDIVPLEVLGDTTKLSNFDAINVFDPFQYYFAFNTRITPWNNQSARCAFFAKLNPTISMRAYGDEVKPANDFLPSGTLGYDANANFMSSIISQYKNTSLPPLNHDSNICVSFVDSAIESKYRPIYLQMLQKLYPQITPKIITSYSTLTSELEKEKCIGTFLALKSNSLDAYEYLVTVEGTGPDVTGYHDKLRQRIEKSQDIEQPALLNKEYRSIIGEVKNLCLMYPLFTMPYVVVYVRKDIVAPDIGKGSINEYYLGTVKFKNTH